jgi:hypothetical protein
MQAYRRSLDLHVDYVVGLHVRTTGSTRPTGTVVRRSLDYMKAYLEYGTTNW